MRNVLTIAGREVRSYFSSPVAYVLLGSYLAQVVAVCEKVVIISEGRVVVEDLLANLTRDQRLDEAYKQAIAGNLAKGAA